MKPSLGLFTVAAALGALMTPPVLAQALPVYTVPADKVGGAVAQGIKQTLVSRGFAANDPRIGQTISAVSTRLATSAGAGSTWLGAMGRLSPWVTAGFLVYEGYKWYTGSDGLVKIEVNYDPSKVSGIAAGGAYWVSSGVYGSDPYSVGFQSVMPSNTTSGWSVWSFEYSGSDTLNGYQRNKYQYSMHHPTYCPNGGCQSATAIVEYRPTGSPANCAAGTFYKGGACSAYTFRTTNGLTASVKTGQTYQQAYDNLPQTAKDAKLHPQTAAEIANRAWRDAAQQPDFPGVPWSANRPAEERDFQPYKDAHPQDWPQTSDLPKAVPPEPIKDPERNPNESKSPSTSTKVDLGPDPGTPPPDIPEPPTDLMKPIKDVMAPWMSWEPPQHSAVCPTWHAEPSIAGHVFVIDINYHCAFVEDYRSHISAVMLAIWIVIAVFIILSA